MVIYKLQFNWLNAEKCSNKKSWSIFSVKIFSQWYFFFAIFHSALINVKTILLHRLLSYARVREIKKNLEFETTETTVIKLAEVNDVANLYSSQLITSTINLNRYNLQSDVTLLISNFILIALRYFFYSNHLKFV